MECTKNDIIPRLNAVPAVLVIGILGIESKIHFRHAIAKHGYNDIGGLTPVR